MKWVNGKDKVPDNGEWKNGKVNGYPEIVYYHHSLTSFIDKEGKRYNPEEVNWLDETEKTFQFENEFWWREVFEQYLDKYSTLDSWSGDYNECLELVKKDFKITRKP
jgi:hypothetical protein